MFGRWLGRASTISEPTASEGLERAVRAALPGADQETVMVVAAIAGLLGAVAYADREYSPAESLRVRTELARVQGMPDADVNAIGAVLEARAVELSTIETPRLCRVLRELGDRELRLQVLEVLVDLAAEDGGISVAESNVLRRLTTALGLGQDDYNALQAKHKGRPGAPPLT